MKKPYLVHAKTAKMILKALEASIVALRAEKKRTPEADLIADVVNSGYKAMVKTFKAEGKKLGIRVTLKS